MLRTISKSAGVGLGIVLLFGCSGTPSPTVGGTGGTGGQSSEGGSSSNGGSGNTGGTSGNPSPTVGVALFFSDLTSGPNSGGQDDKGAFVTIWGNGFGDTRGTSAVTIGAGAADNYPIWTNTKITFQLGALAASGGIVRARSGQGRQQLAAVHRASGQRLFRHGKRQRLERWKLCQPLENDSKSEEHDLPRGTLRISA